MAQIRLEELSVHQVRRYGDVCVAMGDGTAVVVRKSRKLPPMMSAETPAPLMPEDLLVQVPAGTSDPVATVRAALEYLGFGAVLH